MIPIPDLNSVRYAWVDIHAQGFTLHGFFVYAMSDHEFPEYLAGDGLADLDQWSGDECALFVVHTPSEEWIDYTRGTNHPWWKLFGSAVGSEELAHEVDHRMGRTAVLEVGGGLKTIPEVFSPRMNQYRHRAEVTKILRRFDLAPTAHPCLILFKDLKDTEVSVVELGDLVDKPLTDLRQDLKRWFAGAEFKQLMQEAGRA